MSKVQRAYAAIEDSRLKPKVWIMLVNCLIKYVKVRDNAKIPTLGLAFSAGYDVCASEILDAMSQPVELTEEGYSVSPGEIVRVGIGLAMALPEDKTAKIEARSGMASRNWVVEGGRIDADFRGEWVVLLRNVGDKEMRISIGDKIAQVLIQDRITATFLEDASLPATSRGDKGFGSTGV